MIRRSDQPTPGFYIVRLVRGGPPVGARIRHDEDGWWAMIDDVWSGPTRDPFTLYALELIHSYGRESTEEEVNYRLEVSRWARVHRPDHPAADPRKPVDRDLLLPF